MPSPNAHTNGLSDRARTLPGSPIRALLSSAKGSAALDLGGGIPDPALFPNAAMAEVAARLLRDGGNQALQYAPTEGLLPLREFIAGRLQRRGCAVTVERIIVTHGSQQALSTAAALLTSPARAVAVEQPVYPGAMQAFALAEAPLLALPVTEEGWQLDVLEQQRPAAIYVIPDFQNPTGRKASQVQRLALARYAEGSGSYVIEDDAYAELDFEGTPSRPILADAPTRGILVGSFSKTLCPGLRIGWIVTPKELVDPVTRILQASSLQPGTLAQHLASGLLERFDWEAHLGRLRSCYRERAMSLATRLGALGLPGRLPRGGFFLWSTSPGPASQFARDAASESLLVVPERAFYAPRLPGPDGHLRLAFTRFGDMPRDRDVLSAAIRRNRTPEGPTSASRVI